MLAGQDFGGSQETKRLPGGEGLGGQKEGNHGFARAGFALDQPVGERSLGQVRVGIFNRLELTRG